jgi:hypothetical protein
VAFSPTEEPGNIIVAGDVDDVDGVDVEGEPHAAVVARRANDEPSRTNFVIFFVRLDDSSVLIPSSVICAGAGS